MHSTVSDEVSLVDLAVMLLRRWRLIALVWFSTVLVGVAMASMKGPKYIYTATVQLGSYVGVKGDVVHPLSGSAAKVMLEKGLIEQAIRAYVSQNPGAREGGFKISVHNPKGSNLLVLEGKGSAERKGAYLEIERDVVSKLSAESSDQIANYRADLEEALGKAKLSLDRLQDEQEIAAEKSSLQESLSKAKASLANLDQEAVLLNKKKQYIQQSIKLYQKLAGHLNGYISKAQEDGLSSSHSITPTQAMTAMLLNNQVQQNMQRLVRVEQKLALELPQQAAQLQSRLADIKQKKATQSLTIQRAQLQLQNYAKKHQRLIMAQKMAIENLTTRLGNAQVIRLVSGPLRSIQPVGPNAGAIMGWSFVLGGGLAVFAALVASFFASIKKTLRSKSEGLRSGGFTEEANIAR